MTSGSGLPATHAAVALDLERRIGAGDFASGDRLPSELALAREYGTTRTRVRTALASLARRGVVVSRPGTGWLVLAGHHSQTVGQVLTFSQWAAANGFKYGGRIVHRRRGRATASEARQLQIRLGEEVTRSVRVRMVNERPVMIERSTWAPSVMEVIESFPEDVPSVFAALAEAGISTALAGHRIEAVAASSSDAQLLRVRRSAPILQVTRGTVTGGGRPIEAAADRYVPNFVTFDVRAQDVVRTLIPPRP